MAYQRLNESMNTITDIVRYPLSGDYYFYAKIMGLLYVIFAAVFYFEENERTGRSSFLSAMAVSSLLVIILSIFGMTANIITSDIFAIIFVLGGIQIGVWFFTKNNF